MDIDAEKENNAGFNRAQQLALWKKQKEGEKKASVRSTRSSRKDAAAEDVRADLDRNRLKNLRNTPNSKPKRARTGAAGKSVPTQSKKTKVPDSPIEQSCTDKSKQQKTKRTRGQGHPNVVSKVPDSPIEKLRADAKLLKASKASAGLSASRLSVPKANSVPKPHDPLAFKTVTPIKVAKHERGTQHQPVQKRSKGTEKTVAPVGGAMRATRRAGRGSKPVYNDSEVNGTLGRRCKITATKVKTVEQRCDEAMQAAREGDIEKARLLFESMAEGKMCIGAVKTATFWVSYASFEEHCGNQDLAFALVFKGCDEFGAEPKNDLFQYMKEFSTRKGGDSTPSQSPLPAVENPEVYIERTSENEQSLQIESAVAGQPESVPVTTDALATNPFSFAGTSMAVPAPNPFSFSDTSAVQMMLGSPAANAVPKAQNLLGTPRGRRTPGTPNLGSARRVPVAAGETPEQATNKHTTAESIAATLAIDNSLRAMTRNGPAERIVDSQIKPKMKSPEGAMFTTLTTVSASPKVATEMQTATVITPVRRSRRNQKSGPAIAVAEMLQTSNHTFVPNSAVKEEQVPQRRSSLSPLAAVEVNQFEDICRNFSVDLHSHEQDSAVQPMHSTEKDSAVQPNVPATEERAAALLDNDRFQDCSPLGIGMEMFQNLEEPSQMPLGEACTKQTMDTKKENVHKTAVVEVLDDDFSKYLLGTEPSPCMQNNKETSEDETEDIDVEISVQRRSAVKRRRSAQLIQQEAEEAVLQITQAHEQNLQQATPKVAAHRRRSARVQSSSVQAPAMSPIQAKSLEGSFAGVLEGMRKKATRRH